MVAETIRRINNEESISAMFDSFNIAAFLNPGFGWGFLSLNWSQV